MRYPIENLNDESFQSMCQALLVKEHPGVQCFPVGQPDGGRDAVQRETPVSRKFLVYQVKFVRDPQRITDPRKWLLSVINDEIEKVQKLVDRSASTYVLITNVQGSAHLDTGSIDRVHATLQSRLDIPAVCWWRDDVERRLDTAWDIKWAYPDVMSGPDFLRLIFESGLTQDAKRRERTVRAFLADQYAKDSQIRFRQGDLHNSLLDLYVDVHVRVKPDPKMQRHSNEFADVASVMLRQTQREGGCDALAALEHVDYHHHQPSIGAATFLLRAFSECSFMYVVLEGAPGQGKSTISQYICQVHRIRLLQKLEESKLLNSVHLEAPRRLPVRVDLREFAEWMRGKNPFSVHAEISPDRSPHLEAFLAALVSHHAGGAQFSVDDFVSVLQVSAVTLVLDGLDEIADIPTRSSVVQEISAATQRMVQNAASLQIVVTTRPSMFSDTPGILDQRFRYLTLQALTLPLINRYADLWARARQVLPEVVVDIRSFIQSKLTDQHIQDLARNPMQLTILLTLIQAKGAALPEKRTALYEAYMENFIAREAAKSATVRDHRELILQLHQYIAWCMHSEAEAAGGRGAMGYDQLISLVSAHLAREGHDPAIARIIFRDMVDRVLVLVSRVEGTFEFEVQPLREYFAAKFLFDTAPLSTPGDERSGSVPDRFDAIARRGYWLNVARFYAGFYSKGELSSLATSLRDLAEDPDWGLTTIPAQLAMALLSDWLFSQVPRQVGDVLKLVTDKKSMIRLASAYTTYGHSSDQSGIRLPDACGSAVFVESIYKLIYAGLPRAHEFPLLEIVEANTALSKPNVEVWLTECRKTTGSMFDRVLRFGRIVGALQRAAIWELKNLPITHKIEHVLELYYAGRDDVLTSDQRLFDQAKWMLLNAELSVFALTLEDPSCLRVLDLGLSCRTYLYGMSGSPSTLIGWLDSMTHGSARRCLNRDVTQADESMMPGITGFAILLRDLFELPVKEWRNSRRPWDRLIGAAVDTWGELRAVQLLAIVGATIRSKAKPGSAYCCLTDRSSAIFDRTRFARVHAADTQYWTDQLACDVSPGDRVFALLCLLVYASLGTLARVGGALGKALALLSEDDWRWLYSRFQELRSWIGSRRTRAPVQWGEVSNSRMACIVATLSAGNDRRGIIRDYLFDATGWCAEQHRLWVAIDALGIGKRRWAPDLADVRERVNRGATLTASERRSFARGRNLRFPGLSIELARSLLVEPESYPPELVARAESLFRSSLRGREESLAEYARTNGWGIV